MIKLYNTGYSLKDVSIVPTPTSDINSRKQVDPFTKICGKLCYPIFVAPMGTVTDENNYKVWMDNKLCPVIPRTVSERLSMSERLALADTTFVSFSLDEAEEISYYENNEDFGPKYICIDIANGNMSKLLRICKRIKECFGDQIVIMTGNIANPDTYIEYNRIGIDYVRVSIGSGSRCTTSANVGIHYPLATLLDEINTIKRACNNVKTKVIADGGIYNFDDINKCLALGADAVMIGRAFAECEEACGKVLYSFNKEFFSKGIGYTKKEASNMGANRDLKAYRDYYGMSTKKAQKETGGEGNKTSEGISNPVEVKYPVSKWVDNMQSYLRSAMSYCDSSNLEQFKKKATLIILGGSGDFSYRK